MPPGGGSPRPGIYSVIDHHADRRVSHTFARADQIDVANPDANWHADVDADSTFAHDTYRDAYAAFSRSDVRTTTDHVTNSDSDRDCDCHADGDNHACGYANGDSAASPEPSTGAT